MNENMNNSMVPAAGASLGKVRTLEIIAGEIRTFTASMLNNIIEIGRRMCEAKEMLPYGQFGDWIKENTGYSRSTANNFMRVFQEYGTRQGSLFGAEVEDAQTFGKLSYTQALALLALPSGEREEFVETHDVENMSTRELRDAIRERDEARKEAESIQKKLAELCRAFDASQEALEAEKTRVLELESQPTTVEIDQDAIDKAVAAALEKASMANEAEMDKLRETERQVREELKQQLHKAEEAAEKAKAAEAKAKDKLKKAESRAGTVEDIDGALAEQKAATEDAVKAREEAEKAKAEADDLRRKLAMSGEAMTAFRIAFSAWQGEYKNLKHARNQTRAAEESFSVAESEMREALNRLEGDSAERARAAVEAQMEGWAND